MQVALALSLFVAGVASEPSPENALAHHRRAQQTKLVADHQQAIEAYEDALDDAELDELQQAKAQFYLAEVAWDLALWPKANRAYLASAKLDPGSPLASDAVYNAILAALRELKGRELHTKKTPAGLVITRGPIFKAIGREMGEGSSVELGETRSSHPALQRLVDATAAHNRWSAEVVGGDAKTAQRRRIQRGDVFAAAAFALSRHGWLEEAWAHALIAEPRVVRKDLHDRLWTLIQALGEKLGHQPPERTPSGKRWAPPRDLPPLLQGRPRPRQPGPGAGPPPQPGQPQLR